MSLLRECAKGVFSAADVLLPTPKGPRVLIYHRVGTTTGEQMEVSRHDFVWQLDWLAEHREVVDLETAVRRWDEPGGERLVVLTFDDGYEDTYTTAYPLLKERRIPFTLYVATDMVERGAEGAAMPLTWAQISEMLEDDLLTVGAHTHTHRDLRTADYEETLRELEICNDIIERRTGRSARHFAYPWGYWAEPAHRAVVETYETAVLGAPAGQVEFDPHRLFRFPVQLSDGKRWFRSRLRGGLLMEERVRRRLRGYEGP